MISFFSINNTAFTFYHYSVSYLEVAGTFFNFLSVWLATQNKRASWPIGNVGVFLFAILFYHIHLYGELLKQSYYFIIGFYGWKKWAHDKDTLHSSKKTVTSLSVKKNLLSLALIMIAVPILGCGIAHMHEFFPYLFHHAAAYPYLDALLVLMSFCAMMLMAHRKIECWYCFIVVNILSVCLYTYCGIILAAFLYAVLLVISTLGLFKWRKELSKAY